MGGSGDMSSIFIYCGLNPREDKIRKKKLKGDWDCKGLLCCLLDFTSLLLPQFTDLKSVHLSLRRHKYPTTPEAQIFEEMTESLLKCWRKDVRLGSTPGPTGQLCSEGQEQVILFWSVGRHFLLEENMVTRVLILLGRWTFVTWEDWHHSPWSYS